MTLPLRIDALTGLRAFAAFAVVFFHLRITNLVPPGFAEAVPAQPRSTTRSSGPPGRISAAALPASTVWWPRPGARRLPPERGQMARCES
jgi:peptidoglycan/LPS O-acetylase OafA/YrhL